MKTLVIVDVQPDFMEGGALPVTGGSKVADLISELLKDPAYDSIALTQDWHIDPGDHWSDAPDYVDSWPKHCEAYSENAYVDVRVVSALMTRQRSANPVDVSFFKKGQYSASYSGADGITSGGKKLTQWLLDNGVVVVDVVGLAYDYCVSATAVDLAKAGFDVSVLKAYTASVRLENVEQTNRALKEAGVQIV